MVEYLPQIAHRLVFLKFDDDCACDSSRHLDTYIDLDQYFHYFLHKIIGS